MKFLILIHVLFSYSNFKSQDLINYHEDQLWGYKDKMNNVIIKPQYQLAKKFDSNYAVVYKNDSAGIIDKKNNVIIPFKYNFLQHLGGDIFLFGYQAKYFGEFTMGLMDKNLKTIISPKYYYIVREKDFYKVTKHIDIILQTGEMGDVRSVKSLYGLFHKDGKEIIPCMYDQIKFLNENLIVLQKDNLEALYNYKGQALTDFIYMVFGDFKDGLAKVRKGNLFGFINENGKIVIPIKYDLCNDFNNGLAIVMINSKWYAINKNGKALVKKNTYEEVKKYIDNRY